MCQEQKPWRANLTAWGFGSEETRWFPSPAVAQSSQKVAEQNSGQQAGDVHPQHHLWRLLNSPFPLPYFAVHLFFSIFGQVAFCRVTFFFFFSFFLLYLS